MVQQNTRLGSQIPKLIFSENLDTLNDHVSFDLCFVSHNLIKISQMYKTEHYLYMNNVMQITKMYPIHLSSD